MNHPRALLRTGAAWSWMVSAGYFLGDSFNKSTLRHFVPRVEPRRQHRDVQPVDDKGTVHPPRSMVMVVRVGDHRWPHCHFLGTGFKTRRDDGGIHRRLGDGRLRLRGFYRAVGAQVRVRGCRDCLIVPLKPLPSASE